MNSMIYQQSIWKMGAIELEGRRIIQARQISIAISDEIAFLICPENPTFHLQNVNIQDEKVVQYNPRQNFGPCILWQT